MQAALCAAPIQRTEETMTGTNGGAPLEASAELVRTYSAAVNAIAANVLNAQAGFEWLSAQPPNLEEAPRSLKNNANNGIPAGEVNRLIPFAIEQRATLDVTPG